MSTIKEYEYHPPNVRAIRWDGTQETAAEILKAAPLTADLSIGTYRDPSTRVPNVKIVARIFFAGWSVAEGTYFVWHPDGRFCVMERDEFEYNYQIASDHSEPDISKLEKFSRGGFTGPVTIPVTLEDEDYDIDNQLRSTQ